MVEISFWNLDCRFFLRFENLSMMFGKISNVLISFLMNFCQTFLSIPGKQFRIPTRNFLVRSLKQFKNIWKLWKVFRHGIRWTFIICKTCPCEKYPKPILGDYEAGLSILPQFVCLKLDRKFNFIKHFNMNTLKDSCYLVLCLFEKHAKKCSIIFPNILYQSPKTKILNQIRKSEKIFWTQEKNLS